ncbi:Phosphoribosylglycinamide formyltransferase (GART) [Castilleja foliolosa]|uniref:Phosphoribosylglycinamide formyltransferase, chloroplastic n=1 Tax=Castilleja foliolosa TaxID=1961234 RepID=A0ABD3BCM2_9LAMI
METQNPIFRDSLYSSIHSLQIPKNYLFCNLSKIRSPKWVSLKMHYSLSSSALLANSKTQCRDINSKVECKGGFDKEDDEIKRKKLAVFVSGGGSNFRSIHEAALNGSVHGDIVVLVTSKQDCGGAEYARDKHIPLIVFPKKKDGQKYFSAEDLVNTLRSYKVDFILLAGYLKLIPVELVRAYPKSILNIHPSLLPAFGGKGFYGMKVHKAVIASGARYSGPTIHYVDEEYDTGRILAQRVVPVLANDTAEELAARVLHEEHELYADVAAALCEERIVWREDGVPLIQAKENPNDYL